MAGLFDDLIPGAKPGAAGGGLFGDLIPAKPKPAGFLRSVADLGIEAVSGVARGVKATADAFGADNVVSQGADTVDKFARDYLSAASKADDKRVAEIMAAAQDAGVWEQVKAAAEAFTVKPAGFVMNALGTSVPTIAATMIPGVGQAGAAARLGMLGSMGAAQGAGAVKGSIYEAVKAEQMKAGASEADAEAAAIKAQEYGGANTANIVGGAALGGAASATGVQPVIAKMLQRSEQVAAEIGKRGILGRALNPEGLLARTGMGALKETPLEAAQGGQEQYASNIALQNEGFDTPAFRGVAGSAALEGLASAGPGAAFGALDKPNKPGVADILGAPSVDKAIDFSLEAVAPPDNKDDKPLGLATGTDGLPFEADPRYAGAPVLKGGERPAAPVFGSKQQADIYIGEQALFQSHEAVEVAPGRWEVQPTAATRALMRPNTMLPVGEAGDLVPDETINADLALMTFRTPEQIAAEGMPRIPTGEATEVDSIPTGEATELEPIPVGEASEYDPPADMVPRRKTEGRVLNLGESQAVRNYVERMQGINTPAARAFVQDYRAGRITDDDVMGLIVPTRRAEPTADERIAAAAAQAPKREVLPTDILTIDGVPYGSKTAANVRAVKEGLTPANVIEIPGAGWVVRPKEAPNANDVARPDGQRPADAGRGDGVAGVPDQRPGDVLPSTAGAEGQGVAGPGAAGGGNGRTNALTTAPNTGGVIPGGLRVTFGGKTYPVESVEDAQRKWEAFRDSADGGGPAGVSQVGNGIRVTDGAGRFVARISYNGRVWDTEDTGPMAAPSPAPAAPTTALTEGQRVTLKGEAYTVVSATPSAVKLQGADGGTKMVATNSKTFGQIQRTADGNDATLPRLADAGDSAGRGNAGSSVAGVQRQGDGVGAGTSAGRNADADLQRSGAVPSAPRREPEAADGKRRAVAGGQEGINGYAYKGGQFLPSTMAEPGKWKVKGKWVNAGKEQIGPGEWSFQPTPFSRSIFSLIGGWLAKPDGGKIRLYEGADGKGIRDNTGAPLTRETEIRPGVKGVLGKQALTVGELIDAYNNGQRWFDVQPDAETVTTQEPDAQQTPAPRTEAPAPTAATATEAPAAGTGRAAGVEADGLKKQSESATYAVYQATESPAYDGVDALTLDDADFELEAMQAQQERGKLRPDSLAQSEFGKRLDTGAIMAINEAMRADPAGTLKALRDSIAAKKAKAATPNAAAPAITQAPAQAGAPVAAAPAEAAPTTALTPKAQAVKEKLAPDLTTRKGMVKALKKLGYEAIDLDAARTRIPNWGRVGVTLNTIPFKLNMVVELKNERWQFSALESEDPQSISQQEEIAKFKADFAKLIEPAKRAAQTLPPPSANVSNPAADLDTSAGRVQSAATSEPAATHKDPGEPAEPVTPAVVREAIKTAAENEGRSRSAMKADALRLIDEAIAKAPEKGDKKITIKVPGDGVFTVVNNVARLREFRRQVELSPGFKDKQTRPSIGKANNSADYGPDQLAREMLEDGEPLNAVEVLEAAGKTMMFGNGGDSRPIPYTNGEPVEIAGVADLFVGRGWSAKKGNTSWWAVIHKPSGFSMGGDAGSKAEAVTAAKKLLGQPEKLDKLKALVESGKSADGKPFKSQDVLRAEFMEWAEKQQEDTFNAADATAARVKAMNDKEKERDAFYQSIMGDDMRRPQRADWTPAAVEELLNAAEKQGKAPEALAFMRDVVSNYAEQTVTKWEQAYERRTKPTDTGWQTGFQAPGGYRRIRRDVTIPGGATYRAELDERAGAYVTGMVQKWSADNGRPQTLQTFSNDMDARQKADKFMDGLMAKAEPAPSPAPAVQAPAADAPAFKIVINHGGSRLRMDLDRPAWQYTKEQFDQAMKDAGWIKEGQREQKYDKANDFRAAHMDAIEQAKRDGEPIPDAVLYDFPRFIRSDLSDSAADEARDAMDDEYRATKDHGKAVAVYREWGKAVPAGRTYLAVPFQSKDYAKKGGARWDEDKKLWFADPIKTGPAAGEININLQQFIPTDYSQQPEYNFYSKEVATAVAANATLRTGKPYEARRRKTPDGGMSWSALPVGEPDPAPAAAPQAAATPEAAAPQALTQDAIPKSLQITLELEGEDGKTQKKLVNARKAHLAASQRVEKLRALKECIG